MSDNNAYLTIIVLLAFLIWAFFRAVNNFEKKIKMEVFDLPSYFLCSLPWKKIFILACFLSSIYLYTYREQKIHFDVATINESLRSGWYIKDSYRVRELPIFLVERNLINKWLYK